MTSHAPAEGQPFHLIGYTWHAGRLELLWRPWPSGDRAGYPPSGFPAETSRPSHWPITRGMWLHLAAAAAGGSGERRCVGYHPPLGGPPQPCPDWRAIPAGRHSQCDECERREGRLEIVASNGSRPPTGPRAGYLRSAHEVYLVAFAPGVYKVGVSGAGRTALRVLEQGAPAGLIVGRAEDGMAARRLEHSLSLAGVTERVQARTKLRLLYPAPEASALLTELSGALDTLVGALPAGWPGDVERVDPPVELDNTVTLGLDALASAPLPATPPPAGAIRGQVAATVGGLLVTLQPQASLWGDATAPVAEAHDLRVWLGWRVTCAA